MHHNRPALLTFVVVALLVPARSRAQEVQQSRTPLARTFDRVFAVDDRTRPDDIVNDVVAVGIAERGHAIVLATPALRRGWMKQIPRANHWRFRVLPLRVDDTRRDLTIVSAMISRGATKLVGRLSDGTVFVVDLTAQVLEVPVVNPEKMRGPDEPILGPMTHRLAKELLLLPEIVDLNVFSDDGEATGRSVADRASCSQLEVQAIVTTVGGMVPIRHVTPADDFERCTGTGAGNSLESAFDWLVQVAAATSPAQRTTQYSREEARALGRGLDAEADAWLVDNPPFPEHQKGPMLWQLAIVFPEPRLYAPVLEFANTERVFPSDFYLWSNIIANVEGHLGKKRFAEVSEEVRDEALFASYRRLYTDWDPAARYFSVHYAILSFPGSWLIEYWFYYPFDRGQGGHLHDSEHLFVEVDKLGGTVRQEIGAAHGWLSSNNVYRTDRPTVPAVSLPLKALVESGKHATAPDIDGDRIFTIGLDANVFRDRAKVWGIRDATAVTDAHLRAYDASMTSFHDVLMTPADAEQTFEWEQMIGSVDKQTVQSYWLDHLDLSIPRPATRPPALALYPRLGAAFNNDLEFVHYAGTVGAEAAFALGGRPQSGAPSLEGRMGAQSALSWVDDPSGRRLGSMGWNVSFEVVKAFKNMDAGGAVAAGQLFEQTATAGDHRSQGFVGIGPLFEFPLRNSVKGGAKYSFTWAKPSRATHQWEFFVSFTPDYECSDTASEACAGDDIRSDTDAVHAFKALKTSFAPEIVFPRIGVGFAPQLGANGTPVTTAPVEIGGAIEIGRVVPVDVLKFPGRIGAQTLWRDNHAITDGLTLFAGASVSYERLMTNLYGYDVAYSLIREQHGSDTSYRKYIEIGPMLEFAPFSHINIGARFNLAQNNDFGFTYHISVLVAYLPRRGEFGIRRTDHGPFF